MCIMPNVPNTKKGLYSCARLPLMSSPPHHPPRNWRGTAVNACLPVLQPSDRISPQMGCNAVAAAAAALWGFPTFLHRSRAMSCREWVGAQRVSQSIPNVHFSYQPGTALPLLSCISCVQLREDTVLPLWASVFLSCLIRFFSGLNRITH